MRSGVRIPYGVPNIVDMLELNKILIALGLIAGTANPGVDMNFYRQKLSVEISNEQKYLIELKSVEYSNMWADVSVDDKAKKSLEKAKLHEREIMAKGRLKETRLKIKVLKDIIQKDSLDKIKAEEVQL
jgi:hypothetical protein